MGKRNTSEDPLVRHFLDEYRLNLLTVPREGVKPGDLYVEDDKGITASGKVAGFLTPTPKLPRAARGETMADVSGHVSRALSLDLGLGLLQNFLLALGAVGVMDELKAGYQREKTTALRFRFTDATRDSYDLGALGRALGGSRLDPSNALVNAGNRYYLVAGVVRTPSVTLVAEDETARRVELGAGVLKAVDAEAGVSAKRAESGEVTYAGRKRLAIGVELYELAWDEDAGRLSLGNPDGALAIRGQPTASGPAAAFIGGPEGEALVSLPG
jgi:hypothetical protein